jgi:WXXGXW repeat (2 copies)
MLAKKALVSALIAAGTFGAVATSLPSAAATNVEFYVNTAPPPPRYEAVPAPRRGYVWSPGHWRYSENRHRYVWEPGHWEHARPGYAYHAPRWEEHNGRWYYNASLWDRGGDGIPNSRDRTPDGRMAYRDSDRDGIRDSRDRDRDGDGVPSRYDAHPDNPYRR